MNTYDNIDIEFCLSKYGNMVYRLAFIQVKNKEQADDIYQDVFLRLMQQKNKFNNDEHLKAWLIKTTLNCCKDFWKSAWFKKNVSYDEMPEMAVEIQEAETHLSVTNKEIP